MANELYKQIESDLALKEQEIAEALPEGFDIKRFNRTILNALNDNTDLLTCTRSSILMSAMQAAQIGLEVDRNRQHVYFIPRNVKRKINGETKWHKEACCQVGYRGFLDLALRSDKVLSFRPVVVRDGEDFEFQMGTGGFIRHKPNGNPKAKALYVYAIATIHIPGTDKTFEEFDLMTIEECERIRDKCSQAFTKGYDSIWKSDPDAAYKKTVLKRLCKMIPSTPQMQAAISIDDAGSVPQASTEDSIEEAIDKAKPAEGEVLEEAPEGMFGAEASNEEVTLNEGEAGTEGPDDTGRTPAEDDHDASSPPPPQSPAKSTENVQAANPDLSRLRDLFTLTGPKRGCRPAQAREFAMEALDLANRYGVAEKALESLNLSEAVEVNSLSVKDCRAMIGRCGELVKSAIEP